MLVTTQIDPRIKQKNVADLIVAPIVIRVNKFDENAAKEFVENMNKAHDTGQAVIPVVIDSYGGQVYSLLTMVDAIRGAKVPVATIVEGKAMSCGALLFSFGTDGYRFMGPTSTLMIHDVSSMAWGKVEDLKADTKEADRLNQMVYKMMAQNVGQPDEHFLNEIHDRAHADWYLTPTEAKQHKLCNHIRLPELRTRVTVDVSLF